jgi:hypothetical protein
MLVECQHCEATVDGEVVASYEEYDEKSDMTGKYSFLKCPRCKRPFVMLQVDDGPDWDEPDRLYPPRENSISAAIPGAIRSAYEEARACYRGKAYTAATIMCRKTLEGICEEHKITGRNLASALKEMKDQGIIERRLFEWADALRISGNEAAHSVSVKISAQDARDILEFTNALLEYVFTFQDKFEQFKKRRGGSGVAA